MGRNASIMHTSGTGKQEITDQYSFEKKITKKNLIDNSINDTGMKTEFDREGNKLCIIS